MTPHALHHLLNDIDWDIDFDEPTMMRALDYASSQRVTWLEVEPNSKGGCVLRGAVRGGQRQPYHCTISIEQRNQDIILAPNCTCPVGFGCKHAAAMLLVATATSPRNWPVAVPGLGISPAHMPWAQKQAQPRAIPAKPEPLEPWERWLRELPLAKPAIPTVAEAQRQFGVLLRGADTSQVPQLLANAVWLRPGKAKAAGLVDPQPLQEDAHGISPMPDGGWPPGVEQALSLLLRERSEAAAGQRWTAIQTRVQEQALASLLEHYPVYHERGSTPLERAESKPLGWHWQASDDGTQRLHATASHAENPGALLLQGHGLWYVHPGTQRYGKIEGDIALVEATLGAPSLQPEQVEALSLRLKQVPSTAALPAPLQLGPVQLLKVKAVPVLQLRTVPSVDRRHGLRMLGCARLLFDYETFRLDRSLYTQTTRRLHDGKIYDVQRDIEGEARVLEQLKQIGLADAGWRTDEYGIPSKKITHDDLLLRTLPRKQPVPADEWMPTLKQLAAAGFRLVYSADFPHDEIVEIDDWHAGLEPSGNQWFDISLGIDVAGERIDLLPILRRLLVDPSFPLQPAKGEGKEATWRAALDENRSVEFPLARLRALIGPLLEWLESEGEGDLRLHRSQAPLLDALDEHLHWKGGELLRAQLATVKELKRTVKAPKGLKATLRPYQLDGLAWLDFLGHLGLGGILADDMGLGKTVQVLAHILGLKQRGQLDHPVLVVCPTSLVGNWRSEASRFTPTLKVLVIHGADRADRYEEIAAHDLVITTYPLLPRDREQLVAQRFNLLVLDEAQAVKNASSLAARVVREIRATRRLAMTGTPLENHLGELWAQFDAVEPGLLGNQRQFTRLYRTPIEKHADVDRQQRLNRRIGPLLLRRRKDDVLSDLPAKTEIVRTLELEGDQRELYETLRLAQHERVRQAIKERGLAQSGIVVLDALLKLRQACCDPRLVKLASAKKVKASAKLEALLELLDGLLAEGRRVLLFSQFTEMLAIIEAALNERGILHQSLTGQTPAGKREALVKTFQGGNVPVFLISLKAGGVGLNLTAADTVIHYDPWWNPATEAQATDRAHRIGQDKPVFVYRLICAGTVEEKIQAMQARKAGLAQAVLEGGGATTQVRFNEADLAELFKPL
jgi:SNF2 family DNA or RNA helicase